MQVVCDVVRNLAAFETLGEEWESLRLRSMNPSAYLALPWLLSWFEGFGKAGQLRVIVARAGGKLIGAIPLMVGARTLTGMPVRALHSLSLNLASCDFLLSEKPEAALEAMLDVAFAMRGFHILLFRGLVAGERNEGLFAASLARRGLCHDIRDESEIYLDVSGGLDAYRAGRKTKFWANVRNRRGRIEREGAVVFERCGRDADPGAVLSEMFDVSLRSWKGAEGTAVGKKEDHGRFLRRLFERGHGSGHAEAWLLRVDGRAIAYRSCVRAGPVVAELDIAYDEEWKRFSPGTLLAAVSNEAYVSEGTREINLGLDFPWKQEWQPSARPIREYIVYRPGIYPRVLRMAKHWRDRRLARSRPAPA